LKTQVNCIAFLDQRPSIAYGAKEKSHLDYYPFGMLMPERNSSTSEYRYGFQGQEKDDEIKGNGNSVNYKYRMHDPRIGRFLSIDPLEAKYPHNSPYAFSENKVIAFIEMEGLESYFAMDGLYLGTLNNDFINKRVVDDDIALEVQENIAIINGSSNTFAIVKANKKTNLILLENSEPVTTEFDSYYQIPLITVSTLTDGKYSDKPDIMTPENFNSMGDNLENVGDNLQLVGMAVSAIPGGAFVGGPILAVGKVTSYTGTGIKTSVDIYEGKYIRAGQRVATSLFFEAFSFGKTKALGKGEGYNDKVTEELYDIISEGALQQSENLTQEKLDKK